MKNERTWIIFDRIAKKPCDLITGYPGLKWKDEVARVTYDEALTWMIYHNMTPGKHYGIGLVLSKKRKEFCLDIDQDKKLTERPNDLWSPDVKKMLQMFPTAYKEISTSGNAWHVYGTYTGDTPEALIKDPIHGNDLFLDDHLIFLGKTNEPPIFKECTSALHALIEEYFKPSEHDVSVTQSEWTIEPCQENAGIADDNDLVTEALKRRPTEKQAFNREPVFSDFWNENLSVLTPDESVRDYQFAQELAYWTGKNCEQIERIMLSRQDMVRPKWDERRRVNGETTTWLRMTIMRAVAAKGTVYERDYKKRRVQQLEEDMVIGDGAPEALPSRLLTIDEMYARFAFIEKGSRILDWETPRFPHSLSEFKNAFKPCKTDIGEVNIDMAGIAKPKLIDTTAIWLSSPAKDQYNSITFKAGAGREVRDPNGRHCANTWKPFIRREATIDVSPFLDHVRYIFGDEAEKFLDFLAHIEQEPGVLPHHGWLHISTPHGTGRNWISSILTRVWAGNVAANFNLSSALQNGFTGRLGGKILAVVDEIREGAKDSKYQNAEALKAIINEEIRSVNPKCELPMEEWNSCRWLIFSNHVDAIPMDDDDRRLFVSANHTRKSKGAIYYKHLYPLRNNPEFINAVGKFLRDRDIEHYNPGEHATMNDAKREVINSGMSILDFKLKELCEVWPSDVIPAKILCQLMKVQDSREGAIKHAMKKAGIVKYDRRVMVHETKSTVFILRNPTQWIVNDVAGLKNEVERAKYDLMNIERFYKNLLL